MLNLINNYIKKCCNAIFFPVKGIVHPKKKRLLLSTVTQILQNILFCAQQKKETNTYLEQLKGE